MNLHRRNLLLLIVALALAVPTTLKLRAEADSFVDVGRMPLMFDGFTADNVAKIVLAKPKDEQPDAGLEADPQQPPRIAYDYLALQRSSRGWIVDSLPGQAAGEMVGAPVAKTRVEADVLQHLASIQSDEGHLVQPGASAEQLLQFGLDEPHAFVMRATDQRNQVVAELLIGKDSGSGQIGTEAVRGVFVRKAGSDDVVLYEWPKLWRRDVMLDGWLERTLLQLAPERVRSLSIRNAATGAKPFVFTRPGNQSSWQLEPPREELGAVRQAEVEALVQQRLSYISVQRYVRPMSRAGDMAAIGLFPPQIEIRLTVEEDGAQRQIELAIGKQVPGSNEFYLSCNESLFLMTLAAGNVVPFELDVERRMFDPKGQ